MGNPFGGGGGEDGGKGGQAVTIGFRYYMSIHMGLSRGPLDEIVQINVGDLRAWPTADGAGPIVAQGPGFGVAQYDDGSVDLVTADIVNTAGGSGSFSIGAPLLFGGDKKEGGIEGSLTIMMGHSTQVVADWIKGLLGGRVPDFRGVATFMFDGLICAMNPYPKKWQVRARRTVSGWDGAPWHPELAAIWMRNYSLKAMNPAHILYECLTNRDWGRGFPRALLNDAAFLQVAQTLYNEGFGLCLRWNRQDELSDFIQHVINHIGGSLYVDRMTGLLTPALLRGDYDADDLPTFTYDSGLLSIENDETMSREDLINEVIVGWNDPIKNEDRQARIHNLASLQSVGATNSTTTSYDGIPTVELALRVAQRDLRAGATSLKRYKVELDRRGSKLIPGSVFKISAPDKNIFSVVLRAGKVNDGTLIDGKITVDAVLDVFGLPSSSFISAPPTEWTPPDRSAKVVSRRNIREATYAELYRTLAPAALAEVPNTTGVLATMAAKPSTLSQTYVVASRVAGEEFARRGSGAFAPVARLSANAGIYSTLLAYNNGLDLGIVSVGSVVQIGDEICRLDDIESIDGVSGTITLARGCVDTLPTSHAAGTDLFFYSGELGSDFREYEFGETAEVKLLTVTSTQELDIALAPVDEVDIVARQARPYPPADLRVNGTPYGTVPSIAGDMTLSWKHRDRKIILDQLIEHQAASIGPEAGTTYNVRIYPSLAAGSPVRTETGIVGDTWAYTSAQMTTDGITGTVVVELAAFRDDLVSTFKYRFSMTRTA